MKKKFNIIFMGTPDFAVPPLKALADYDCNLSLVITQPDRPKGRGKKMVAPPVKIAAMELGLNIMQTESMNVEQIKEKLVKLRPDLFVVVAFGHKLSCEVLSIPSIFPINIHASLLPKYRGSSPIQSAILNMEKETGVTTMIMDESLDTGDILLQRQVPISCDTNASDLHDILAQMGADLIIKTLDAISENKITPIPQNNELATFSQKLKKSDGKIDWGNKPERINALVNAMTPWPGAFTFLNGKRIKVFKVACTDEKFHPKNNDIKEDPVCMEFPVENINASTGMALDENTINDPARFETGENGSTLKKIDPGTILFCDSRGIRVAAGNSGYVTILELQTEGGRHMHACEFLRGRKIETGIRFDN